MKSLPVFMYHHINRHRGDLVTLSPEDFENHLRFLKEGGIETFFLDEAVRILEGQKDLSRPAVVLTFDDGHLDNWVYAFPLLKKYRAKATIFVVTSWMGDGEKRENTDGPPEKVPSIPTHREVKRQAEKGSDTVALRWAEAKVMEEGGLVDIQSHTHFHNDYFAGKERDWHLDGNRKNEMILDLKQSKELIEQRLGKRCRFLSWPWGKYDHEAIAAAKSIGFEAMVTTEKGVNFPGSDITEIKRVVAKSGDPRWFRRRVQIYSHRALGQIYSRVAGKI